jgi:hypothetical protein
MGGFRLHTRKRRDGARIFVGPIEPGAGQELHPAVVDAHGHAKTVQLISCSH